MGVSMHAWYAQADVGVGRDGAFLAVDIEWLIRDAVGGFGNVDDRGDEAEFFVHHRAGHAAKEGWEVAVVIPIRDGTALEVVFEVSL